MEAGVGIEPAYTGHSPLHNTLPSSQCSGLSKRPFVESVSSSVQQQVKRESSSYYHITRGVLDP